MRHFYATQEELNADAKQRHAAVIVDKAPDAKAYPDSKAVHYFVNEDGAVYRQFAVVDGAHVVVDGVFVIAKFVPVRTGTPLIDWPLLVDTFANGSAYGYGASAAVVVLPAGAGELTPAVPAGVPAPVTAPTAAEAAPLPPAAPKTATAAK